ncbi:MAG: carbohydrate binding family 9 domain-containing protein [Gemmatimonadetes bacterium]|nr:carbohydrate binding family 9 domain-containing protein [Gemmatimonadota bacterium]
MFAPDTIRPPATPPQDTIRGPATSAQDTTRPRRGPVPRPTGEKRIESQRVENGVPHVDGRLDDPAWQRASWASDFLQKEPDQGAPPTQPTEVAFVFDDDALYVGARLLADDPAALEPVLTRRDEDGNAERLVVSLDTYHDRRTAYSFAVTTSGVRLDWFHPEDDESRKDDTFNPVWLARTARDATGWTAEMRIPFSQLRFSGSPEQVWGVNVHRIVPARNETDYWVYVPRDESGWVSRFGELTGLARIPPSRRIEVVPYVAGDARLMSGGLVNPDNPLEDGSETGARTGVDVKMGLGSSLTFDATINPDFGQVEADPAQVNLSAFEVFFDERRAFFTEGGRFLGAHLYADQQSNDPPGYFYSRRIGGAIHGVAQGDFVDAPPAATILGAAKLTGRLPSGLSVGMLGAVTGEERARTYDLLAKRQDDVGVEPLTGFGVTRLEQQFGPAGSTAALMLTAVRRDVSADDPLAALLAREAYAGGLDWNLRFRGGEYDLKGHAGFSHVAGERAAIERIQRAPAHYFQRPDQGHVELDSMRTTLSGASASMRFRKVSGGHWRAEAGLWGDAPGHELNDVGRLNRADDIASWGNLRYREDRPGPVFRSWQVGAYANGSWNFGGVRRFSRGWMRGESTWNNFWKTTFELGYVPPWTNDNATRGGPLMEWASGWDLFAEVTGNEQARTTWSADVFHFQNGLGGNGWYANGEVATRPATRWQLSVAPHASRATEARQFMAAQEGGPAETFGTRYVFAIAERSELSAQLRVNYAFSPDLGLELYAEPFASSGRFHGFGELPAPRSRELRAYGTDGTTLERDEEGGITITEGADSFTLRNADFNVRSLRSNLLLRWEWQPGSTLFLVWQGNRSADSRDGSLVGPGALLEAFGAEGEDVLALKITYWLPVG